MSEEELKQIIKNEFISNIKNNLNSATIFTYVDNLEKENKHLNLQLDQALKDYDELLETKDKAIEEINYMRTNVDITEIGAIKLKQILGDKE